MRERYYQIAREGGVAEIYIFGDVTSWEWLESDVSSYTLARELQGMQDAEEIRVYINSYGGEVAEATAIYNQLRGSKARVTTVCSGFACSAASVIFMAGEERLMHQASRLMIHNAMTSARGNAEQLRKAAEDLESINDLSIRAYMDRVSIGEAQLRELMDRETWIRPEDAVEMGFATGIAEEREEDHPGQSARASVLRAVDELGKREREEPPTQKKILKLFLEGAKR